MKKIFISFIVASVVLLSGCVNFQLSQPLPVENRIGVISNFKEKAQFRYVGTTVFNDVVYEHELPGLQTNSLVTHTMADLLKSRGYKAEILPIPAGNIELKEAFFASDELHFDAEPIKGYLEQQMQQRKLQTLILIEPSETDCGNDIKSAYKIHGYGFMEFGAFGLVHRAFVCAGYRIVIIQREEMKVLAQNKEQIYIKSSAKLWKDKYDQLSSTDIQKIEETLKAELPKSLTKTALQLLRIN